MGDGVPAAGLDSYFPTPHILRAALRVGRSLSWQPEPLTRFRSTFAHLPTDGLFTVETLRQGEEVLVRAGIASRDDDAIVLVQPLPLDIDLLATALLERVPPPWLGAATRGDNLREEMIPLEDAENLAEAIGDAGLRDALLLALGQKFDDESRRQLGEAGEQVVVEACRAALHRAGRSDLSSEVVQVSRVSDLLGYDVRTPTTTGQHLRLEVKTNATSGSPARVFLSRNEWETGRRDLSWRLVVCGRGEAGEIEVRGWLEASQLEPKVPSDPPVSSRWQSVELQIPESELRSGLPPLAP